MMMHSQRFFHSFLLAAAGALAFSGAALAAKPQGKPEHQDKAQEKGHAKQSHHQNGKQLLGEKIKTNGRHVIDQKGDVTTSVEVRDGKVAGLHAKHTKKGELPVTKYKTTQKMAQADGLRGSSRLMMVQDQYVGTIYIGYAYYDDYGNEEIYWFPYDMILDGVTGAIDYVPATST